MIFFVHYYTGCHLAIAVAMSSMGYQSYALSILAREAICNFLLLVLWVITAFVCSYLDLNCTGRWLNKEWHIQSGFTHISGQHVKFWTKHDFYVIIWSKFKINSRQSDLVERPSSYASKNISLKSTFIIAINTRHCTKTKIHSSIKSKPARVPSVMDNNFACANLQTEKNTNQQ